MTFTEEEDTDLTLTALAVARASADADADAINALCPPSEPRHRALVLVRLAVLAYALAADLGEIQGRTADDVLDAYRIGALNMLGDGGTP